MPERLLVLGIGVPAGVMLRPSCPRPPPAQFRQIWFLRAPGVAAPVCARGRRRAEVEAARRGPRCVRLRPRQPRRAEPPFGDQPPLRRGALAPATSATCRRRGCPRPAARFATGTSAATARSFDPDCESVITIGAKEGLAHLLLALAWSRRLRALARPLLSIPPLRCYYCWRRAGAGRRRPRQGSLQGDRGRARARAAQAQGPDRQLPAQPDVGDGRPRVLRKGRAPRPTARTSG